MASPGAVDTVLVVAGGDPIARWQLPVMRPATMVIAADSGIDHARSLGLQVDVAVGDFDSVTAEGLAWAEAAGAEIERHPRFKDATDLELALTAARDVRPARVHVVGGHGGRLDHLMANVLLLASPSLAAVQVTAQMGPARLTVIRSHAALFGGVGDLVSLLAVHDVASDVTTSGLRYALVHDVLRPGSTRGVSNELVAEQANVEVGGGVVVAVQPGPPTRHSQEITTP